MGSIAASGAVAEPVFNRIASFPVPSNLPADMDQATETSAEIIAATEDGMALIYTDSPFKAVGFIDLTDPEAPAAGGIIKLDGEPTSVAGAGDKAFVGVNTSGSYTEPSGNKGVEAAVFGDQGYIFVSSERGSIVGVYKDTGAEPEFLRLLPSGIGPEGLLAIPERNLFVVANEMDLIEDGGVRAHVMLVELGEGEAAYPTVVVCFDHKIPL